MRERKEGLVQPIDLESNREGREKFLIPYHISGGNVIEIKEITSAHHASSVVASWLVRRSRIEQSVVLCPWARHYSHIASLHPGVQICADEFNAWFKPAMD